MQRRAIEGWAEREREIEFKLIRLLVGERKKDVVMVGKARCACSDGGDSKTRKDG